MTDTAKLSAVQALLTADEIDALDLDNDATFRKVAEAVMEWNALLLKSGIIRKVPGSVEVLASSHVILGTLFSYAYALGIQRGERGKALKGRKRA